MVHVFRAATTTLHIMATIFHHHFMPAIVMTAKTVMCHPANAASYKANEKDKSNYDKEPGDKSKEFAGHIFFEFCKKQGSCKDCQQ
jgi:hypothetical protein